MAMHSHSHSHTHSSFSLTYALTHSLSLWLRVWCVVCLCQWRVRASGRVSDHTPPTPSHTPLHTHSHTHSDYLYLYEGASTLSSDITGVFAAEEIPANTILCEYRGVFVSESEVIDPKKLHFKVTHPDGHTLILIAEDDAVDDTATVRNTCTCSVCTRIKDCTYIHGGYTPHDIELLEHNEAILPTIPGFSYNAVVYISGVKVFILSQRIISKDEEIFFAYGSEFWIPHIKSLASGVNLFQPTAQPSDHTSEESHTEFTAIESEAESGDNNLGNIFSIGSDDLLVYAAPSSLGEVVGLGLFAKSNIPKDMIICEYRGAIMDMTDPAVSAYSYSIASSTLGHKVITAMTGASKHNNMYSLAMYINDCVSLDTTFSEDELFALQNEEFELPLLPGCTYNADAQRDGSKVFAVAIKDIKKDEEIFFPYGSLYWMPRLKIASG